MRKTIVVVALLGLATVGVPAATGAPSPLTIAKKALRVATGTKKALKRSYSRTHPTEVVAVDGGEHSAAPLDFAHWDIECPRGTVVAGSAIGYGALEPVSDLSYGSGALISLFNPSETDVYSGFATVNCIWALGFDSVAKASTFGSKREAVEAAKRAEADVLAARR